MPRIVRLVCWLASPAGLVLIGLASAAAQGTPEMRQLCASDAMRLCTEFIPDVPKITKCMIAKYKELSEPCQKAMGHKRKVRHHRHRKSRKHCPQGGKCSVKS